MASRYSQISGANPWASGSVAPSNTLTIDVQFQSGTTTAGSAGGVLCNRDWPAAPDGPMIVGGTLIVNMNYPISTVYFGYGVGTLGSYTQPTITSTGKVEITGSGAFDGTNFINFINTTINAGTLTVRNLSMFSGDANSAIQGPGTLNLINARSFGNIGNYNACMVGSITGGQTINMIGSDLSVYLALKDVTINMIGGGNYLALRPTTTVSNVTITGFSKGDIIDVPFTANADTWSYNPQTGNLTVTSSVYSFTVKIGLGYDPSKFRATPTAFPNMYGVTYWGDAPCFLRGTLIRTAEGEIPVEALVPGDMVLTLENGALMPRPVKSVQRGSINTRLGANLPPDEAYLPVVVQANALDENVPASDLYVTSDHCFLFDDILVPVRTLINGRSIRYDHAQNSYDFFHVDLDEHRILFANGALTESLLRQGMDSLPLETSPSVVRRIFDRLAIRAGLAPHKQQQNTAARRINKLTVQTGSGKTLEAERTARGQFKYLVPPGETKLRLLSRAERPCDVIGVFHDDRRYLGHLIGAITFFGSSQALALSDHLQPVPQEGWHAFENDQCRWTNGNALLTLPAEVNRAGGSLCIEVIADVYAPWCDEAEQQQLSA